MSENSQSTIRVCITIDIPVDVANNTLRQLEPVIARLTSRSPSDASAPLPEDVKAEEEKQARTAEIQEHYEEQKRRFVKQGVQAYRIFRRVASNYEKPSEVYRLIAQRFEWTISIVPGIISARRRKVDQYVKRRRSASVLRLAYDGLTNQQIADRVGISQPTVSRMLREARKDTREVCNA